MNNDLPMAQRPSERGPNDQPPVREPGALNLDTVAAVGARLAQLRVERGLTLNDVSARLKVSLAKLKALEAGDLSLLPDATFALGIVRSYAKMLGTSAEPMLPALRVAYGTQAPDLTMPASSGASLPRGKMAMNWRTPTPRRVGWVWGLAVVVVAAVLLLVWRDGREPSAWLARFKPHPAANLAVAPAPAAVDAASAAKTVASSGVAEGETPGEPPSVATAAVDSRLAASSVPAVMAPAAPAKDVDTAAAPASASADAGASVVTAGSSGLVFTLKQDSWVSVRQQDGHEVFSGLLHAGESAPIQGTRPFKIIIGNEQGVSALQIDGHAVDLKPYLNTKGNVARFTLP